MKMTANRIKAVALSHFARYGYEGTSLANIAQEVGIKKPSIYAHFKGKEELYFICLESALQKDLQSFTGDIEKFSNSSTEELLLQLLKGYAKRFGESEESMFWLRLMHFANKLLIKRMYTLKTSENFYSLYLKEQANKMSCITLK